jgi:serine protease Do
LPRIVGSTKPGNRSTITVFRRGSYKDLNVTVAEVEADRPVAAKGAGREDKPKGSVAGQAFGLTVAEITDAQKKELAVKGGVRVEAALDAAARAGLRDGDIILQIGNSAVLNVKEFEVAIGKHDKSKPLNVLFRRGDWTQYAVIRPNR